MYFQSGKWKINKKPRNVNRDVSGQKRLFRLICQANAGTVQSREKEIILDSQNLYIKLRWCSAIASSYSQVLPENVGQKCIVSSNFYHICSSRGKHSLHGWSCFNYFKKFINFPPPRNSCWAFYGSLWSFLFFFRSPSQPHKFYFRFSPIVLINWKVFFACLLHLRHEYFIAF